MGSTQQQDRFVRQRQTLCAQGTAGRARTISSHLALRLACVLQDSMQERCWRAGHSLQQDTACSSVFLLAFLVLKTAAGRLWVCGFELSVMRGSGFVPSQHPLLRHRKALRQHIILSPCSPCSTRSTPQCSIALVALLALCKTFPPEPCCLLVPTPASPASPPQHGSQGVLVVWQPVGQPTPRLRSWATTTPFAARSTPPCSCSGASLRSSPCLLTSFHQRTAGQATAGLCWCWCR